MYVKRYKPMFYLQWKNSERERKYLAGRIAQLQKRDARQLCRDKKMKQSKILEQAGITPTKKIL